ncbi:LuxR C-terminal-related transcriptional regulator [Paraburkholderia sediminicola]|uniref:response regulator transcription factor n=1 Tax=Paraburkholderia sediminicola TaxID=458836 RepID=UPI0038B879A3
MTSSMPLVALVDDDESVCRALMRLLRLGGYRVETHGSAQSFLERGRHGPDLDCLVLDVHLPDVSGLHLQRDLAVANGTPIPIVFISGYCDVPATVTAMRAGAVDFLIKPIGDIELLDAIGRAIIRSTQLRAQALRQQVVWGRIRTLTVREREVLLGVVSGRMNKQIAYELEIAEKTVKVHRAHVMDKLEVQSLVDLIHFMQEAGMNKSAGFDLSCGRRGINPPHPEPMTDAPGPDRIDDVTCEENVCNALLPR